MRRTINKILAVAFMALILVGCADLFAPGLRQATEQLTIDFENTSTAQLDLTKLVNEGQLVLVDKIEDAKASIETINFRSEEDKAGAVAMIALLEGKVTSFFDKVGEEAGKLDTKVATLFEETKPVLEAFAEADTPAEGLSVLAQFLTPMLGPYAPIGELALGLLGLGGTHRVSRRRGETRGITEVAAPIEKARNREIEDKLKIEDPSRKYIVFDAGLTKSVFDSNGVKSIISSFGSLANRE